MGGAEAREDHRFNPWLEAMAGVNYNQDNPRRDNLDHYLSSDPRTYGAFVKVLANNLTILDIAPFVAIHGNLGSHLQFYGGLRHDQIEMKNSDLLQPSRSFDLWKGLENPKATLAWNPGVSAMHWMPSAAFSIGQAFFTEDPRIGLPPTTGPAPLLSPLERSHSEQLVLEKAQSGSDVRVTLGRTTTTATLAKIDPDTGLPDNLGPGSLKFLTASVRHQFDFGSLQGVFSKADARDVSTGMVTPEAPRTIFDVLAALDQLPAKLHARGEYEYVGHKLLDAGGFESTPVTEWRLAIVRRFLAGHLELGANGMLARGSTGQTTETFAPDWQPAGPPPSCAAGIHGITNDFECGTVERSVGVRLPSFVGASISWRIDSEKRP